MADLAHGGPPVEYGLRARDRYVDVREVCFDVAWPHVIDGRLYDAPRRTPGHALPALAREFAQRARAIAADDHADVVERRGRRGAGLRPARGAPLVGGAL